MRHRWKVLSRPVADVPLEAWVVWVPLIVHREVGGDETLWADDRDPPIKVALGGSRPHLVIDERVIDGVTYVPQPRACERFLEPGCFTWHLDYLDDQETTHARTDRRSLRPGRNDDR